MAYSPLFSLSWLLFLCLNAVTISFAQWDVKLFAQKLTVHVFPQVGSKEKDLITSLPGQHAGANFTQYSGYIAVDSSGARNQFYYFAEAGHQADSKPLVLWLSGGVGASSIGLGAFQQHGPFQVNLHGASLQNANRNQTRPRCKVGSSEGD